MNKKPKTPDFLCAVERFRQKLLNQEFQCAQPIRESVLAMEFGVSRPAMREALSQAIGWGVVEYVPYCGYRIKDFTLKELLDWSVYRESIEGTAVRLMTRAHDQEVIERLEKSLQDERLAFQRNDQLAASDADNFFHETIVSECGNHRLASPASFSYPLSCFRGNFVEYNDYVYCMSRRIAEHRKETPLELSVAQKRSSEMTIVQHMAILEAIKAGDSQLSEAILRGHIRAQTRNYELLLEALGEPDVTLRQLKDTAKYLQLLDKADWTKLNF